MKTNWFKLFLLTIVTLILGILVGYLLQTKTSFPKEFWDIQALLYQRKNYLSNKVAQWKGLNTTEKMDYFYLMNQSASLTTGDDNYPSRVTHREQLPIWRAPYRKGKIGDQEVSIPQYGSVLFHEAFIGGPSSKETLYTFDLDTIPFSWTQLQGKVIAGSGITITLDAWYPHTSESIARKTKQLKFWAGESFYITPRNDPYFFQSGEEKWIVGWFDITIELLEDETNFRYVLMF